MISEVPPSMELARARKNMRLVSKESDTPAFSGRSFG